MARKVNRGAVEYRRKGNIKGWDTTEICTPDFTEIGRYLRGNFDPSRTRVWITACGTVFCYEGGAGRRALRSGEQACITLIANIRLSMLGRPEVVEHMYQERKAFLDKEYCDEDDDVIEGLDEGHYNIDYYCVRTREAL